MKSQSIPLVQQELKIRNLYGDLIESIHIVKSELICIMNLQPSEHSDMYKVKIAYKISDVSPKVWLLSPELQKVDGKAPHHVYGKDKNGHHQLCVYHPRRKEWNQQMFIAESFIPWVCTWLNTYEYWVITGEWHYDEAFPREGCTKKAGE